MVVIVWGRSMDVAGHLAEAGDPVSGAPPAASAGSGAVGAGMPSPRQVWTSAGALSVVRKALTILSAHLFTPP